MGFGIISQLFYAADKYFKFQYSNVKQIPCIPFKCEIGLH